MKHVTETLRTSRPRPAWLVGAGPVGELVRATAECDEQTLKRWRSWADPDLLHSHYGLRIGAYQRAVQIIQKAGRDAELDVARDLVYRAFERGPIRHNVYAAAVAVVCGPPLSTTDHDTLTYTLGGLLGKHPALAQPAPSGPARLAP